MSDENQPQTNRSSTRRLLDLQGGNRRGLERAMQHLLGRRPSRGGGVIEPAPASALVEAALNILMPIGFEVVSSSKPGQTEITHPLAEGRVVALSLPESAAINLEEATLDFALSRFPEMDFYLPFITTRARYLANHKKGQASGRFLEPEPEYDEDGFLS